jgi:hypothetical protein
MMVDHSPKEWRELYKQLTALRDNPFESTARRAKASDVLGMIRRNPDAMRAINPPPKPPPVTDLTWVEMEF